MCPAEEGYCKKGAKFGPITCTNRRSFQSEQLIFATYQNAGVRVFDITDPFAPREVSAFCAACARKDGRPATEPPTGDPIKRCLCGAGRADVRDRRQ